MKRNGPRDRGGVIVEFGAVLPLIIFIVMVCFQALIASTTVERIENAARTGAREASKAQNPGLCMVHARRAMPTWVNGPVQINLGPGTSTDEVACHVAANVPLIWPGIRLELPVDRTVRMPLG